jgi:hypothetical protein
MLEAVLRKNRCSGTPEPLLKFKSASEGAGGRGQTVVRFLKNPFASRKFFGQWRQLGKIAGASSGRLACPPADGRALWRATDRAPSIRNLASALSSSSCLQSFFSRGPFTLPSSAHGPTAYPESVKICTLTPIPHYTATSNAASNQNSLIGPRGLCLQSNEQIRRPRA